MIPSEIPRRLAASLATVLLLAGAGRAAERSAPLADAVPADALLYVGWAGSAAMGDRLASSRLTAALKEIPLAQLLSSGIPTLLEREEDEVIADQYRRILQLLGVVYERPGAIFLIPPFDEDTPPSVWAVIDGGADPDNVAKRLAESWPNLGESHPTMGRAGNLLYVGMPGQKWPGATAAKSLASTPAFTDALRQVRGAGDVVMYGSLSPLIDKGMAVPKVAQVLTAAGASNIKLAVLSARFESGDWVTDSFLAVPGARTGVVETLLAPGAVEKELASRVPSDAMWMGQSRVNVPELLDRVVAAVETVQPDARQKVRMGLGIATMATGVQLRPGIIDVLGPDWVYYMRPNGDSPIPCLVALNRPKDGATLVKSLDTLAGAGQRFLLLAAGQNTAPDARIPKLEITHDGSGPTASTRLTVTTDELPQPITLSWGTRDGLFAIGLGATAASDALGPPPADGGLVATPRLKAAVSRLGVPDGANISFADVAKLWPQYLKQADSLPAELLAEAPELRLPELIASIRKVAETLPPAASAMWTDDAGFHTRGITPFPGADLASPNGTLTTMAAAGPAILLPSLNRARETANRIKCGSNMRMMGQGIQLYANENKGKYPPDLATLVKTQDLALETFACPSSNTGKLTAETVDKDGDYVYLGKGFDTTLPAEIIVIRERDNAHDREGMNVLYGDGHVEFFTTEGLKTAIEMSDKALAEWKKAHP